jgi:type I restriction enzyme, S subunit
MSENYELNIPYIALLAKVRVPVPGLPIQEKVVAEVHHRRAKVRHLHAEPEAEWQAAKERFEQQLLSGKTQ